MHAFFPSLADLLRRLNLNFKSKSKSKSKCTLRVERRCSTRIVPANRGHYRLLPLLVAGWSCTITQSTPASEGCPGLDYH